MADWAQILAHGWPGQPFVFNGTDLPCETEEDWDFRLTWLEGATLPKPTLAEAEALREATDADLGRVKSVSRVQLRLALLELDLLDTVDAAIEQADRASQILWRDGATIERNHPLVSAFAAALGKTEAEVDALFALAATKT